MQKFVHYFGILIFSNFDLKHLKCCSIYDLEQRFFKEELKIKMESFFFAYFALNDIIKANIPVSRRLLTFRLL